MKNQGLNLSLGIRFLTAGSTQQIINADIVKICKNHQSIHRIIQNTQFILRVSILADAQLLRYLFLRIAVINAQIADIFEFHNLISHHITQEKHTISENEILRFI